MLPTSGDEEKKEWLEKVLWPPCSGFPQPELQVLLNPELCRSSQEYAWE